MYVQEGKIKCTNTLESRLELISTQVGARGASGANRLNVPLYIVTMCLAVVCYCIFSTLFQEEAT